MKMSDWKYLERIQDEIDAHHSGEQDATETMELIRKIIADYSNEREKGLTGEIK